MHRIVSYLDDASKEAYDKLKAFGMNMQNVVREALIKKAEELKRSYLL